MACKNVQRQTVSNNDRYSTQKILITCPFFQCFQPHFTVFFSGWKFSNKKFASQVNLWTLKVPCRVLLLTTNISIFIFFNWNIKCARPMLKFWPLCCLHPLILSYFSSLFWHIVVFNGALPALVDHTSSVKTLAEMYRMSHACFAQEQTNQRPTHKNIPPQCHKYTTLPHSI